VARKKKHEEHVNHERWLVSYADFITLLFATFTALFAISNADLDKFRAMSLSMERAFNGEKTTVSPIIEIDPDAKGSGNMVINIVEAPFTSPKTGGGEGPERGGAAESPDKFNPVERIVETAKLEPDDTTEEPDASMTPEATPIPIPTQAMLAVVPDKHEEDGQLGTPEGKANDALASQVKRLLSEFGLTDRVDVRKEQRGTVISLSESTFFAAGGVDVLPASVHVLDKVLNALRGKEFEIRIEGHTDNTPVGPGQTYRSNEELSSLRASRVMEFMMKEYRFPADKLSISGYGAWRPIADNGTPEGREKNRRVDLVILNQREIAFEPR
jgi:chemotaxis protein MotB